MLISLFLISLFLWEILCITEQQAHPIVACIRWLSSNLWVSPVRINYFDSTNFQLLCFLIRRGENRKLILCDEFKSQPALNLQLCVHRKRHNRKLDYSNMILPLFLPPSLAEKATLFSNSFLCLFTSFSFSLPMM